MGQITEDIYTLAKRFFEQDYHDRGMVKWQGYYLSDHTEDVAKYSSEALQRTQQQLHEKQSLEEIGQRLKQAYDAQLDVIIQLAVTDVTGLTSELITGKIKGYTEQNIALINDTEVAIDTINAVNIVGAQKGS